MNETISTQSTTSAEGRDLILVREFEAAPNKLYRAWTEPELLTQWFTPAPWTTPSAKLDVRPGGANVIKMRGPDGTEFPNRGVYLEVVPNKRLVFTDAYTSAWVPAEKPFIEVGQAFDDLGDGRTRLRTQSLVDSFESRDAWLRPGMEIGVNEGYAKLERMLNDGTV